MANYSHKRRLLFFHSDRILAGMWLSRLGHSLQLSATIWLSFGDRFGLNTMFHFTGLLFNILHALPPPRELEYGHT